MSYLAFGGGGTTSTTAGIAVLATTGVATEALDMIWEVATICLTVGILLTLSQYFRRVAIDPVMMPSGKYRPWLTLNGRPVGRRFKNR